MVNLTRIYTRTGDAGRTRLGDMSETSKTDLRLEAYACVDEGNAHIGVVGTFDDAAGWKAYIDHPEHQAVVQQQIRPHLVNRTAIQQVGR